MKFLFFVETTYNFWGMGAAHSPLLLAIAIACHRIIEGVGVIVPASMGCDGKDRSWNLNFVQVQQTHDVFMPFKFNFHSPSPLSPTTTAQL